MKGLAAANNYKLIRYVRKLKTQPYTIRCGIRLREICMGLLLTMQSH